MHRPSPLLRSLMLFALFAAPWIERASGCVSAQPAGTGVEAAKIAAIACRENALWYKSPFIDATGRLASNTVSCRGWRAPRRWRHAGWMRVVEYWRGSGIAVAHAAIRRLIRFATTSAVVFLAAMPRS